LWQKKRGKRRTGSKLVGGVGEALFYAALLLIGIISLAVLVASQVLGTQVDSSAQRGWSLLLGSIVGSAFVLIGGGGVAYSVINVSASAERRSALARRAAEIDLLSEPAKAKPDYPTIPPDANLRNSPGVKLAYRLPIHRSPTWIFLTFVALWVTSTGIASVMSVWALDARQDGNWLSGRSLVTLIVVGAAVASTYAFVRSLLLQIILGPTTVEISDHPLHPGENYQVYVSQAGHASINRLQLRLVCEEEATYQQGTNVRTETQCVCSQQVFCKDDFRINPGLPFEHQCEFRVPPEAMHSFKSASNAVHWRLVVRGSLSGWPDFERTFPVIVYPCHKN
jgi:hypothetical protein